MKKNEYAREVGMISAIIAMDHGSELYEKFQKHNRGFIDLLDEIAQFAEKFIKKHEKAYSLTGSKDFDWCEYVETTDPRCSCWDDLVLVEAHEYFKELGYLD